MWASSLHKVAICSAPASWMSTQERNKGIITSSKKSVAFCISLGSLNSFHFVQRRWGNELAIQCTVSNANGNDFCTFFGYGVSFVFCRSLICPRSHLVRRRWLWSFQSVRRLWDYFVSENFHTSVGFPNLVQHAVYSHHVLLKELIVSIRSILFRLAHIHLSRSLMPPAAS